MDTPAVISEEAKKIILAHADEFFGAWDKVEGIIEWGKQELEREEKRLREANGTFGDFADASEKISAQVKAKLKVFEDEIKEKYSSPK